MDRPYSAHGCFFNGTCFKLMQPCNEQYQLWCERILTIFVYNFMNEKNGERSDFMMPEANLVSVSSTLHIFRSCNLGTL